MLIEAVGNEPSLIGQQENELVLEVPHYFFFALAALALADLELYV